MVLEEGANETSYGDDKLPSSLPPELRRDAHQIRADFNRFDYSRYQHPLPILGPPFGFKESRIRRMVAAEWAWARHTLERPLKEEEEDALASATCKQMRTMSYAGPLGVVAGLYRAHRTRESWRLPFWAMSKDFDPNVVRIPGGRQLLQGEAAKSFWRILRNVLYTSNGVVFTMCFFLSFSASSVSVAIARDPRLTEFAQTLSAKAQQQRRQRMRQPPGPPPTQQDPTGQGQRSAGELWRNHRQEIEGRDSGFDNASPSSGMGTNDGDGNYSGQNPTYGSQDSYLPENGSSRRSISRTLPPTSESELDNGSGGDIMDDLDASPTAQPRGVRTGSSMQGTGSAWERVRRQAADGSNPLQRAREVPTKREGDNGFSFSNTDEERQLARSEAQKEFDARIERERHGGDFDNGRGRRNW